MYRILAFVLLLSVFGIPIMAYADPPEVDELSDLYSEYIGISFQDTGPVWTEEGVITAVLTPGEEQFTLDISETYPGDVENCWVYFNGDVYSGTSVYLTASTFRDHYGAVAIEFDDDALEYASFVVYPYWPADTELTLNEPPPSPSTWMLLPQDVESVFLDVNGIEPYGPAASNKVGRCVVVGTNGDCDEIEVNLPRQCWTDADCKNYP